MNILPKKSWHVRTKENIARVRKDEAEAAEKEKQENQRVERATREARLNFLKQKSKERIQHFELEHINEHVPKKNVADGPEHINLFDDINHAVQTTNKDHDREVKEKNEEYEKKIGYLTYLGQDTNEALKKKNWYEVPRESSAYVKSSDIRCTYDKLVLKDEDGKPKKQEPNVKDGEIDWKVKQSLDPLNRFKKLCSASNTIKSNMQTDSRNDNVVWNDHKKKTKNSKTSDKEEKEKKIQKLKEARLKREKQEKLKTELFLKGLAKEPTSCNENKEKKKFKPKYNSQFNPEFARQNHK